MKTHLLTSALSILGLFFFSQTSAQTDLLADQNPNFASSRDKYMRVADSVNQWHSTTVHQPYKAYDWYEQRLERREEDRRFHQALQLEWARNGYGQPYYHYYSQPYYNNSYYYEPYYRNRYYRNYRSSFRLRFCW